MHGSYLTRILSMAAMESQGHQEAHAQADPPVKSISVLKHAQPCMQAGWVYDTQMSLCQGASSSVDPVAETQVERGQDDKDNNICNCPAALELWAVDTSRAGGNPWAGQASPSGSSWTIASSWTFCAGSIKCASLAFLQHIRAVLLVPITFHSIETISKLASFSVAAQATHQAGRAGSTCKVQQLAEGCLLMLMVLAAEQGHT